MSVKKVKISELPQLQPSASGEGLFMPASDENNHTYRVPLSRYDNIKNEAATAAATAQRAAEAASAAAEAAHTAADRANGVADNSTAEEALAKANAAQTKEDAIKLSFYARTGTTIHWLFKTGNVVDFSKAYDYPTDFPVAYRTATIKATETDPIFINIPNFPFDLKGGVCYAAAFRTVIEGTPKFVRIGMPFSSRRLTSSDLMLTQGRVPWIYSATFLNAKASYGIDPDGVEVVVSIIGNNSPNYNDVDINVRPLFSSEIEIPSTLAVSALSVDYAESVAIERSTPKEEPWSIVFGDAVEAIEVGKEEAESETVADNQALVETTDETESASQTL